MTEFRFEWKLLRRSGILLLAFLLALGIGTGSFAYNRLMQYQIPIRFSDRFETVHQELQEEAGVYPRFDQPLESMEPVEKMLVHLYNAGATDDRLAAVDHLREFFAVEQDEYRGNAQSLLTPGVQRLREEVALLSEARIAYEDPDLSVTGANLLEITSRRLAGMPAFFMAVFLGVLILNAHTHGQREAMRRIQPVRAAGRMLIRWLLAVGAVSGVFLFSAGISCALGFFFGSGPGSFSYPVPVFTGAGAPAAMTVTRLAAARFGSILPGVALILALVLVLREVLKDTI